ncbi:MAG: PIN domain-containing protein [Marinospirillum sp.]|uniref:type II toxin-antitoxin system VapC family toxin n=1 Tax=Marinospirillum sp. TaxID=2183934 RepID=UPI0019F2CF70|nr:PIN domain-containing protein [Marinospirillum sp.]MBE0506485.1 PIN domain-containing protein [Marinospirillum sp.]
MTRKVLLDANLLIAVFDPQSRTEEIRKQESENQLLGLLQDSETALVITPLIRYEVLRGIPWKDGVIYQQVNAALDAFTELDVDQATAELAANLFRFDRQTTNPDKNLDKRKFDAFHLATAKCHQLELASLDSDIAKLETLYAEYMQHIQPEQPAR